MDQLPLVPGYRQSPPPFLLKPIGGCASGISDFQSQPAGSHGLRGSSGCYRDGPDSSSGGATPAEKAALLFPVRSAPISGPRVRYHYTVAGHEGIAQCSLRSACREGDGHSVGRQKVGGGIRSPAYYFWSKVHP